MPTRPSRAGTPRAGVGRKMLPPTQPSQARGHSKIGRVTALYRKYRPQGFDEVVGQEAVVRTLRNAIEHDEVPQAYLFAGPRGTGRPPWRIRIDPRAIDSEDPRLLADMVLAAVNEALRSAQSLMQSKVSGLIPGDIGGLGGLLPGS
jgi:hypothetical protein